MKKTLKYSVGLSAVVLVLLILSSILFGVYRTATGLERAVLAAYNASGSDGAGRFANLSELTVSCLTDAKELAKIAADAGVSPGTLAEDADRLSGQLAADPFVGEKALSDLFGEASVLYYGIQSDASADPALKEAAAAAFRSMETARKRLGEAGAYAEAAKAYNEMITAFPASLILAGRKTAVLFR